jgi:hypothetical protein
MFKHSTCTSTCCDFGHLQFCFYLLYYYLLLIVVLTEAGHILYLRILYPIHIQAPKKDIISKNIQAQKKDVDIYPISFVKFFASIVTVSELQKARTGSTAAHKTSTFYWIELKP